MKIGTCFYLKTRLTRCEARIIKLFLQNPACTKYDRGLVPNSKEFSLNDVKDVCFCYKFVETPTSQYKKRCDDCIF